ncbi:response regulator [Virgibacillus sp. 179-BFC.A HS]|uniref:Response regulator n=1 Tax=Tigheibacillus jepli TaxID=3035914 RepID=A0ABU5CER6_9BACI|nr:response regulator [Virgibacillus sp. 179-BFC.A HS]MDY0404803.1 response regulator [Virgibacillus sp. 179-BFC.A HS]
MRIIIAEDELLERKAMKKFIAENFPSMEVVAEAENGRKAIQLAAEKSPDLMLMDIKMPGINGLDAIETIQKEQPHIKFIVVSAYDSFAYAKKAMQFGIKDYILKPSRKEEIVQTLLRVKKEVTAARERQKEKHQTNELLQEQLLRKVMQHPITDEVKQLQQQLFAQMKSGTFLVVHTSDPFGMAKVVLPKLGAADAACITTSSGEFHIVLIMTANVMKKEMLLLLAKKSGYNLPVRHLLGSVKFAIVSKPFRMRMSKPMLPACSKWSCEQAGTDSCGGKCRNHRQIRS